MIDLNLDLANARQRGSRRNEPRERCLTDDDGWQRPRNFKEVPAAAQKWLTDNASTYRIRAYVPEK